MGFSWWSVYLIRTKDQLLYAGIATDVQRRFEEHCGQGKKASRFLKAHKPEALVFFQRIGDRSLALKVEYYLKRSSRTAKEAIIKAGRLHCDPVTGKIITG